MSNAASPLSCKHKHNRQAETTVHATANHIHLTIYPPDNNISLINNPGSTFPSAWRKWSLLPGGASKRFFFIKTNKKIPDEMRGVGSLKAEELQELNSPAVEEEEVVEVFPQLRKVGLQRHRVAEEGIAAQWICLCLML